jgi:hypothetical protein
MSNTTNTTAGVNAQPTVGVNAPSDSMRGALSMDKLLHLSDLVAAGMGAVFSSAGVSPLRPWKQATESLIISIIARFLSTSIDVGTWTSMGGKDKNAFVVAILGAISGSMSNRRPAASALVTLSADLIADEVTRLVSKGDGSIFS